MVVWLAGALSGVPYLVTEFSSNSNHSDKVLLLRCKCKMLFLLFTFSLKCFKSQKRKKKNDVFKTALSHPPSSLIKDC